MAEALYEVVLTFLLSLSGVALAWIAGLRQPTLLAATGLALIVILRVATFLVATTFSAVGDSRALWLVLLSAAMIVGVALAKLTKGFWLGASISWIISLIAISVKYGFGVGERFHEDSVQIIANSVLVFETGQVSSDIKRGLALPLMLNLGADGVIFSSFIPLVFGHLLLLAFWFGYQLLKSHVSLPTLLGVGLLLALVSISTPMIRVLAFYINSHTMVALGVGLVTVATLQLVSSLTVDRDVFLLVHIGGMLIAWSRFEGVAIFLLAAVPLLTLFSKPSQTERIHLWLAIQTPVWAWFIWASMSSATLPFIEIHLAFWVPLAVTVLTGLVLSPAVDRFRHLVPVIALTGLAVLVPIFIAHSLGNVPNQLRNLVLGLGGWGFVAPAFLLLLFLIGLQRRTRHYRTLLLSVALAIFGTIAIKYLDQSGIGRQGFNDSINRAWSHWLVLWWWVPALGLAELLGQLRNQASAKKPLARRRQIPSHDFSEKR